MQEPKDLFRLIINEYEKARIPIVDDEKIKRGRSRSVSAITEDIFADFLISNKVSIDQILIDQPFSIPTTLPIKRNFCQIYPDITIIRQNRIDLFIDLKMDLGWNRDGMLSICEKHFKTVKLAAGKSISTKDGVSKQPLTYEVSEDIAYCIVIISGLNINQDKLREQLHSAKSFMPIVEVFVLSYGEYLNTYSDEVLDKLKINYEAFNRLFQRL